MDPSWAAPREYLRQAIDAESAEIRSLEGSIRALRHRRNAFAPISSLPAEVILIIFSLLRAPGNFFVLGEKPDHLAWLRVAHVCHQWREITLNRPLFWSRVDFTTVTSAGAAEILARAKMVPLHLEAKLLFVHWDEARFSAFQKELQDHVSHIRHLSLCAESIHFNKILNGLTSPAPILEYLSLDGTTDMRGFVTDTLFDGSTPSLSRLELRNCAISWKSPLLRGLKHLHIGPTRGRTSLSVWLDALDEMPQLETLALEWSSPTTRCDALLLSRVERTVTLPSLTRFEISDVTSDCGLALAHLVLPALTSLCVRAASYFPLGSDVTDVLPHVARHAHGPQHTQPLRSAFVRSHTIGVEILAWSEPDIDAELPNEMPMRFNLHSVRVAFAVMNIDWFPETHTVVFDAVMAALPLGGLITLATEKHTSADKQFWLRHAPQWPLLQHLRLAPLAARGFRKMLLQEDNGGRESSLLPSLTKLVLVDTALSPRRTRYLCDALMKRVEQGIPLETLDLRTCLASRRAVELLSEIVVEVLGPEEVLVKKAQIIPGWDSKARRLFVADDDSGVEDYYGYNTDSEFNNEGWDDEGCDGPEDGEIDDGETDDDPNE